MSEDSLEEKALELIKSRPNGVLQSDLWKDLDIDSRKCSRVIAKLEADGKIKRTWETVKGTRTYRISYLPQKKEAPKKEVDFGLILVNGRVAPCIGCTYECEPDYCPDLGNWIELLSRMPEQAAPKVKEVPAPAPVAKEAPVEEEVVPVKAKKAPAKAKSPAKAPVKAPEKVAKPSKAEKPAVEAKPAKAPARKATISSKSAAREAPAKPAAKAPKAKSAKKK